MSVVANYTLESKCLLVDMLLYPPFSSFLYSDCGCFSFCSILLFML